jgi:hypothetical protein
MFVRLQFRLSAFSASCTTDTVQTYISVALLLLNFATVCPCVIFIPLPYDWTQNGLGTSHGSF